ncbi:uncharacterized protein LOC128551507 [Mercenaria mercenaria]|uniref:uncharacterized protein LOC128551507 n=1 Tax=Mercenaria mercenaria TaxID=6596 RepID=UPI00234F741D|nr:uncharacterized protein LOC128551507 [Mercenaria mercenaria]
MLKLLQRASEICRQVSYEHMDGMKKSICTLTVRTNPSDLSRRTLKSKQQINVRADSKANDMTDAKRSRRNSQQDYTEAHGPSIVVLPDTNVEDDSIEYIVQNEYEVIQSSNTLVPETSQMQLREVTCDLQHDQKKIIMELRKSIEDKLSGEIEAFVTDTIARENHIDNLNQIALIKYIAKCVSICWAMCRLEPPVFIGFPEVQGDMFLDTNVYKPYTKTGQFVDYIVWPVLYLHENGPVLSKGVAQGRE